MNLSFKIGLIAMGVLFLASCKTPKDADVSDQGPVASEELVNALDSLSGTSFESYYSKIATSYKDSSRSVSFKTSTWMIADSASNFLITFAKFPVVSALVTKDSLTVVNRREKCFQFSTLDALSAQFGTELSLDNLQDIILGIPTNFDREKTYYQTDENSLTLCSHGRKDIEQVRLEGSNEMITYYTLNESLTELEQMTLVSFKDTTEINLTYNSREIFDGFNSPTSATVNITSPSQNILVELGYTKIRANQGEEIQFIIPESYGECK